jgi:hypothetical protein
MFASIPAPCNDGHLQLPVQQNSTRAQTVDVTRGPTTVASNQIFELLNACNEATYYIDYTMEEEMVTERRAGYVSVTCSSRTQLLSPPLETQNSTGGFSLPPEI